MHCIVPAVIQPPYSPDCALRSFGSKSPSLLVKIGAIFTDSHTCMLHAIHLVFFWFSNEIFLSMSVSMSLGIVCVRLPLSNTCTMDSRIEESKALVRAQLGMQSIKCL